jgi:hypothetical protein
MAHDHHDHSNCNHDHGHDHGSDAKKMTAASEEIAQRQQAADKLTKVKKVNTKFTLTFCSLWFNYKN